jgi:hypothetical protein
VAGHEDARVAGITGFWYGKSPGVDRASDTMRHANLIGTHPRGGAVAARSTTRAAWPCGRPLPAAPTVAVAWQRASSGDWTSYAADVSRRTGAGMTPPT